MKRVDVGTPNRVWQQKALADFQVAQDHRLKNYLAFVTPGGGKTLFALRAARNMLDREEIRQIVVTVHTHNLRLQWIEKAADQGIILTNNIGRDDGQHGFVVTYQQLGDPKTAESVHEATRGTRRCLSIIDEIHHAAESKTWGEGLQQAFRDSWRRLLLSGTPFRRDEARIPFVDYRGGIARPSFSYGYMDALNDGIVAPIYFPTFDGRARWRFGDQEFHETANSHRSQSHQDRHLNTLLRSDSWLKTVLRSASDRLDELRQHQPNAGGLVVARDQNHARHIHMLLARFAGRREVALAISDENDAHDTIEMFDGDATKWLVSVRMVSEGVDIPRFRVGVYASNYLTELFFRQVVGRLVRVDRQFEDQSSFLYLPAHGTLAEYARMLTEDRIAVLRTRPETDRTYSTGQRVNALSALSATAIESTVVLPGSEFSTEEIERARVVRQLAGMAHLPIEVVASILRASETRELDRNVSG